MEVLKVFSNLFFYISQSIFVTLKSPQKKLISAKFRRRMTSDPPEARCAVCLVEVASTPARAPWRGGPAEGGKSCSLGAFE